LRTKVDRQIQHRALYRSIHYPLHFSCFLLEHENVIVSKECHGGRATKTADNCPHVQSRIHHCRLRLHSLTVDKHDCQEARKQHTRYRVTSFRHTSYEYHYALVFAFHTSSLLTRCRGVPLLPSRCRESQLIDGVPTDSYVDAREKNPSKLREGPWRT